ncbi:hypothetical protein OGZ51_12510 [Lactococcus lactis]|uniref:Uncharacterized protein n=1 Tax=Lactococcus lactis TaxID=1358 RepID=A0A9X4S6E0_9LACT|nr:hypothetical protein [Lactococcus lactis]MDG4984967.1 hypothetical protein [Lactococcus lactis]
MYINASVLVFEIIFLLFFYKNMHSSKVRIINEVFLVSLFSFSYTHFTFLHTITFTGIIYLLLTTLLLFSFSFVLTGLFEYQYGLLIFTLVNVLVYIGSETKLSSTGLPVAWTDFNSGLFIEVVWNMYLKQNYPYVILAIIILLGILYIVYKNSVFVFNFQNRFRRVVLGAVVLFVILLIVSNGIITRIQSVSFNDQGILVYFISSEKPEAMPLSSLKEAYTKHNMEAIVKKYEKEFSVQRQPENSKETLVTILSEAFSDPGSFSNVNWKEDPMPNIRKLQKESGG